MDMITDSESNFDSLPCINGQTEDGKLSDPDLSLTNKDQTLSEEQTYRKTMRSIRSYMGWSHIPDVDSDV